MQQVYGDDALSCSVVFRWHRLFRKGETVLSTYDDCSGRLQTVRTERKIEYVTMLVLVNRS